MKTRRLLFLLLLFSLTATAQQTRPWEDTVRHLLVTDDEEEESQWEETLELLTELARQPIDINKATREELEQLVFLTSQQLEELLEYRDRYGPMKSMAELRMVRAMDWRQLEVLPYFIMIDQQPAQHDTLPSLRQLARYGRHELVATASVPFYERRGDQNGYLGYPYRHWLRYDFSYGDRMRLGLTGSQDAGEPFFSNKNRTGYDFYSFFVQVKRWGRLEQLVVGKYKLRTGLGLVVNNSFAPGKTGMLSNLGRPVQTVRPHASRSQSNHFQGAAATLRLSKPLRLTLFASWLPMDATLNKDQTAATLLNTGYHRTQTEMEKKNNTTATSAGGYISLRKNGFHLGATALYTHLDRKLKPNTGVLYRRYYATGSHFLNASMDYGYTSHAVAFSGETAINGDGQLATINTASLQLSSTLSVIALQRFYAYRYTALFARSFSEGSHVQNESGFYAGCTWQPVRQLRLQAYSDYAYFAWARYQVSQSSHAWDNQLTATYTTGHWSLTGRYRLHLRQKDNPTKSALDNQREQRARLSIGYESDAGWTSSTQGDLAAQAGQTGYALSQRIGYKQQRWQAQLGASWFRTDSYATRLYVYERSTPYTFYFPMLYGRGWRVSLFGQAHLTQRLTATAKLAAVHYTDREVIGTGLQQINSPTQTDLDLQLRWRF